MDQVVYFIKIHKGKTRIRRHSFVFSAIHCALLQMNLRCANLHERLPINAKLISRNVLLCVKTNLKL